MLEVILKRFEAPDEVRRMPKGRFEIVRLVFIFLLARPGPGRGRRRR